MMDKQVWLEVKEHQISLYRERATCQKVKRRVMFFISLIGFLSALIMPWVMIAEGYYLVGIGLFILFPVSMLIWKFSTHENRAAQLLTQLADAVEESISHDQPLDAMKKAANTIETRFLSNDDELFVKKAIWGNFLDWKKRKRDEVIRYYKALSKHEFDYVKPLEAHKRWISVGKVTIGPVWNTDIPHKQGYKDSNTIEDEWAIMKSFRRLMWHNKDFTDEYGVLKVSSELAQQNPVVFERFLRKKKISKKMKMFKLRARVHYLSAAAKMRLVTFVEGVLALEPTDFNEATVMLLHEKNEQIKKYTDDFWKVHRRSIKFYWFEAMWLLLLIPFLAGAASLVDAGAVIEAILLFTVGAALVAFGEMALIVRQKIKLNGKKLIPPLIASLIGSRYAMCADTTCEEGIEVYRCRFKNLEKHFIMTTPEIDSVKYVKDNLRDEERTSKLHAADEICQEAQTRMDTYHRMFHLYRRRCLQYGCLELFMVIALLPVYGISMMGAYDVDWVALLPWLITPIIMVLEGMAIYRHIRVWRFKELYFKIYQGLSVLMVDGNLRQDPDKLNSMFQDIEQSAINAISSDPAMRLMADTLTRVSGLQKPESTQTHPLDEKIVLIEWVWWNEKRDAKGDSDYPVDDAYYDYIAELNAQHTKTGNQNTKKKRKKKGR